MLMTESQATEDALKNAEMPIRRSFRDRDLGTRNLAGSECALGLKALERKFRLRCQRLGILVNSSQIIVEHGKRLLQITVTETHVSQAIDITNDGTEQIEQLLIQTAYMLGIGNTINQNLKRNKYVRLQLTSCRSRKSFVLFFKAIVFNALIPNILLSRLSDEQKCIFFRI